MGKVLVGHWLIVGSLWIDHRARLQSSIAPQEEPVEEPTDEPVEEPTDEPVQETTDEPDKPDNQPMNNVLNVSDCVRKYVKELTQDGTKKSNAIQTKIDTVLSACMFGSSYNENALLNF